MKTTASIVLLGIVLVGCGGDSRRRASSGEPLTTESAQRSTPQAPHKAGTIKPSEPEAVFAGIKAVFRVNNLRWIEFYCQQRDIRRLGRDRARLFIQPMGVVAEAIEIDLTSRQLTVYPGTHSKNKIVQTQLNEEQTAQIRALVTSDEFENIPRENKKMGADGTSYLVEVRIDNFYSWKLHWLPDDKELIEVVKQIQALARKQVSEQGAPPEEVSPVSPRFVKAKNRP